MPDEIVKAEVADVTMPLKITVPDAPFPPAPPLVAPPPPPLP